MHGGAVRKFCVWFSLRFLNIDQFSKHISNQNINIDTVHRCLKCETETVIHRILKKNIENKNVHGFGGNVLRLLYVERINCIVFIHPLKMINGSQIRKGARTFSTSYSLEFDFFSCIHSHRISPKKTLFGIVKWDVVCVCYAKVCRSKNLH